MSESRVLDVRGECARGFEPLRTAFEANFVESGDVGAALSVVVSGETVVDLVGGWFDETGSRPYDADTLQVVFSATKGIAAICANLLAQRGQLDLDAPVADYWPEFAANGKADIPVRWVLSHQAGIPAIDLMLSLEEALGWEPVVAALADQRPIWEPGTRHGYHGLTYGWLVGELVRRITGRSLGAFVREEIAEPLGVELYVGLPPDLEPRVSPVIPPVIDPAGFAMPDDPELAAVIGRMMQDAGDPTALSERALSLNGALAFESDGPVPVTWNRPDVHAAEIPAANGITNARALARVYGACVAEVDGVRLLDDDQIERALEVQASGPDEVVYLPTSFGLGFYLSCVSVPMLGLRSFGHAGAGGSLGFADAQHAVGFGYVMNQMRFDLVEPRHARIFAALHACLDKV